MRVQHCSPLKPRDGVSQSVADCRTHSHAGSSGCHLGHQTWLLGSSSRGADGSRWSAAGRRSLQRGIGFHEVS